MRRRGIICKTITMLDEVLNADITKQFLFELKIFLMHETINDIKHSICITKFELNVFFLF